MRTRPGKLAVRAINQYRRRDVLAYLGLRYYLDNESARTDRWTQEVATDLVLRRSEPCYFQQKHFKEITSDGAIRQREIFIPGPNEALAEAALIDACAQAGDGLAGGDNVYSYRFPVAGDLSGIFQPYMPGLRARQNAIGAACRSRPDAKVAFLDVRQFYPSVSKVHAQQTWGNASVHLPAIYRDLGVKLLDNYAAVLGGGRGLLTGPMFSHLIANLVLRSVDAGMQGTDVSYFRYVDDMTIVGSAPQVERAIGRIHELLERVGLDAHGADSAKSSEVFATEWLAGENDFGSEGGSVGWMVFVGNLKRYLLIHPEQAVPLADALGADDFRIPVPDYRGVIGERGFVERMRKLLTLSWLQKDLRALSVPWFVLQARLLRDFYIAELMDKVAQWSAATPYERKRSVSKLRYAYGRLAYLATPSQLIEVAEALAGLPNMQMQSAVLRAIATGRVDEVIGLGANAAQAVAQPLSMARRAISLGIGSIKKKEDIHAAAMLEFAGLRVDLPAGAGADDELFRFASHGADAALLRSKDAFVRELACLHGIGGTPRHQGILTNAFDPAEDIALDAIDLASNYLSL